MEEDRYRIKKTDYEKEKESIPLKEQTSISPYGISRAELEAASKVLSSKQKLPSYELPTFHFYDKATMEITEDLDSVPLKDSDLHKKSDKELHEIRQHVETIMHYRMHGGKKLNEANMGGPMFTWNKDSKAFHNPDADPHKPKKAKRDLHSVMSKAGYKTQKGSTNSFKKGKTTYTFEDVNEANLPIAPNRKTAEKNFKDMTQSSRLSPSSGYSKDAVDKEIKKDKRIGGKEAKKIHALLKGWRKD
jgi:hypothetical protein